MSNLVNSWRDRARALKRDVYSLYLAARDPRTPLAAKVVAACVVAYAFSPIDLIPDFIPVLGHLDDLVLIPLGVLLVIRLIPPDVLAECRARADEAMRDGKPTNWVAAAIIVVIWICLAILAGILIFSPDW